MEAGLDKTIRERSLNRPALAMTGYFKFFARRAAIQLAGRRGDGLSPGFGVEHEEAAVLLGEMFKRKVPCIVVSRNLAPFEDSESIGGRICDAVDSLAAEVQDIYD